MCAGPSAGVRSQIVRRHTIEEGVGSGVPGERIIENVSYVVHMCSYHIKIHTFASACKCLQNIKLKDIICVEVVKLPGVEVSQGQPLNKYCSCLFTNIHHL